MSKGGRRQGAGRPKGSLNVHTKKVKDAVIEAFDELGGVDYLVSLGRDDPRTFVSVLAKVIPMQVDANVHAGDLSEEFRDLMRRASEPG